MIAVPLNAGRRRVGGVSLKRVGDSLADLSDGEGPRTKATGCCQRLATCPGARTAEAIQHTRNVEHPAQSVRMLRMHLKEKHFHAESARDNLAAAGLSDGALRGQRADNMDWPRELIEIARKYVSEDNADDRFPSLYGGTRRNAHGAMATRGADRHPGKACRRRSYGFLFVPSLRIERLPSALSASGLPTSFSSLNADNAVVRHSSASSAMRRPLQEPR